MSTDRTSMDDLLSRRVVDEREKSPDDAPSGSIAESNEPEAFTDTEALPDDTAQPAARTETQPAKTDAEPAKPSAQADDDTGTETRGLPRALHARVKAADERKRLAEERATALERENAELRRRYEQGQQPDAYQDDADQGQPEINVDPQLHATRLYYSEREANRDFGAEQVAEAKAWGQDICATNPQFNAAVFQHPDPIRFVIEQFRRVQVEQQLAEHGWDLDKLVKARSGAQPQPAPATAPAASHNAQPNQPQQQPRMPNDFASSNSGGGRVNGDNAGPTPLSELLSVNARRR